MYNRSMGSAATFICYTFFRRCHFYRHLTGVPNGNSHQAPKEDH